MGSPVEIQSAVQIKIDAQQTLDAIEYGIRSIEVSRSAWGASAVHSAQIVAGCQAAARVLGRFVGSGQRDSAAAESREGREREMVKAIVADVKAIGNARQLRLALAA